MSPPFTLLDLRELVLKALNGASHHLQFFPQPFLTYKQRVCCNWPFSQGGFSESAFPDQHIPIFFKYFQVAAVKKI